MPFANTRVASFFALPPPVRIGSTEGVDLVIGNPPYIRYQDFFAEVAVVSFRQAVFPDVQEEVVLLLASAKDRAPTGLRLADACARPLQRLR